MDYARQTRPLDVITDPSKLAQAVQDLLDQAAIRDLSALYSIARDDNDIESVLACFARDGAFVISGNPVVGHDALREFYAGNMDRYRTSLHVTHTHVIELTGSSSGTGLVTGHAELSFGDTLMLAAYRYADRYSREDGRWVFAERVLKFMYTVPFADMPTSFRDELRIRWPGTPPAAAEIPESAPTWTTYRLAQPQG